MATNIQMNIKGSNGSYTALYPQTSALQIAEGTLADARIPSLAASKITSGTFDSARIPSLAASKITAGTFQGTKTSEYVFPGHLRIGGTGSSSDARLRIGDSDYVYLHEYADDCLDIYAKTTLNLKTLNNQGTITLNGKNINDLGNSGTVAISGGGTGATTASTAVYNLLNGLSSRTASNINNYASSTYLGCYYSTTGYKVPISNLLTYFQNNISSSNGMKYKIVTRTGTGNGTFSISHGLGVVPQVLIVSVLGNGILTLDGQHFSHTFIAVIGGVTSEQTFSWDSLIDASRYTYISANSSSIFIDQSKAFDISGAQYKCCFIA